jgi:2,5-diketo-D-gluconate reductase A
MRERNVQIEAWSPLAQGQHNLLQDPALTGLADTHGKSAAQVVLRWLMQRQVVTVVKSTRPERMRENLAVFGFELSDDEMTRIAGLDGTADPGFDQRDPASVDFINNMKLT